MSDQEAEQHFPCPSCGADLRFAPGEGQLICDHCGHAQALTSARIAGSIPEIAFREGVEAALPEADTETRQLSRCPNCGAEVAFDATVHSADCPFCATPVVVDPGLTRRIRPKGVAPFVLTEPEARAAMADWLGRLWFAPSSLVEYARKGRTLDGIYLPFWTFDANTASRYSGRRGTTYYVTQSVTVRDAKGRTRRENRQVPRIRWTAVSGHVARFFDDVLVLASRALPAKYTNALQPWDLSRLEPYQPEFLAGFRSETYTVSLDEGMAEARGYMDRMIERDVRFDIGGDRQEVQAINTEVSAVTFKHILLPVWSAAYRYRGKSYGFVVNGQSGKVEGARPWSWVKIAFAVVLAAVAVGGAIWLSQYVDWQQR
ncbi:MAG: TFIIB-type zinc finger domain-containing protein [Albidovulum sp.]